MKLISEIIWAEFQNWVRICLWSESGFRSEFVFGPNCRRAGMGITLDCSNGRTTNHVGFGIFSFCCALEFKSDELIEKIPKVIFSRMFFSF